LVAAAQPLFWGSAPDGRFMFGSDPVDLAACDPTPTGFPAGAAPARPGPPALRPPRPFSVCRLARACTTARAIRKQFETPCCYSALAAAAAPTGALLKVAHNMLPTSVPTTCSARTK